MRLVLIKVEMQTDISGNVVGVVSCGRRKYSNKYKG